MVKGYSERSIVARKEFIYWIKPSIKVKFTHSYPCRHYSGILRVKGKCRTYVTGGMDHVTQ
jgi:hypothetical protein